MPPEKWAELVCLSHFGSPRMCKGHAPSVGSNFPDENLSASKSHLAIGALSLAHSTGRLAKMKSTQAEPATMAATNRVLMIQP